MTLDAQTIGVVDTDLLTSERPAAPSHDVAPPTPSDPANLHLNPLVRAPDRGDGQWSTEDPSTIAVANPSARPNSVADHSTNASGGSAHTSPDTLGSSGAPNISDPAIEVPRSNHGLPGRGGGHVASDVQKDIAAATLSEPANSNPVPNQMVRARRGGHKTSGAHLLSAPATLSDPAPREVFAIEPSLDHGGGHRNSVTLTCDAAATLSDAPIHEPTPNVAPAHRGDGQSRRVSDDQRYIAIATIVDLWRQRIDLRRAEGRLNLQALSTCRRGLGGDKEAAQKAWTAIRRGKDAHPDLALVVEPYRQAIAVLDGSAKALEKQLCKMVRPLALWAWAADVRGLGELSIAGMIGESAGSPGAYKSVSALWKRFGLAVIEGGRQRRVADAQAALIHGYAPQRRAFAYVISTQLMRSQRPGDPYRAIYDQRKAYELAREIPKAHAHNRALRYMVKALFRDLWAADRRGSAE